MPHPVRGRATVYGEGAGFASARDRGWARPRRGAQRAEGAAATGTPAGSWGAPVVPCLRSLAAGEERAEETHPERDLHQQQHERGGEWHEPERLIVLEGGAAQTGA